MQVMTLTSLEHQIAPRLEQDIHKLFLSIRHKQGGKYHAHDWCERLLSYLNVWHLLFATNDYRYGFWLETMMQCYRASQIESGVRDIRNPEQARKLITMTLSKLERIFLSAEILEELKEQNERHVKQIQRYQDEYDKVTQYDFDLNKINLICAYQPEYAENISILQMNEHIRTFNKYLKQRQYFPVSYLYWYRRVVRIPDKNQYVMVLSLTMKARIYTDTSSYSQRLKKLWDFATAYKGMVIDLQDESQYSHELVSQMFSEFDDQDDLDGLLKRDIVNSSEPYQVCRRLNILRDYSDEKTKLYPRN
ncbi:hypothetical protein GPS47_13330 [Acinetobacter haemolyticus]|uniref:hypothetical protein n=1 Tax=Acinetobacter haemolyticus TaxID=29430 RepID=UPI0013727F41|nr:hypothetical protein [Acinetobacter haemolyticus]NAS06547.1 hypothetical protein [Acinetobacter haemolyticus]